MTAPVLDYRPAPPSTLGQAIATVARGELRRWRPAGRPPLRETDAAATPVLGKYYRVGVGATVPEAQLRSAGFQAKNPWSAVFISYVLRTAGAGPAFAYSRAHQTYVRAARRNRLEGRTGNPFWAYRVEEIAPRVGDLVCAARSGSGATYDNIGDGQIRATHCDVVTEVEPGRIRVIGGNVDQSVTARWRRTGPDGRLDRTGDQTDFFAVLSTSGRRQAKTANPAAHRDPRRPGWKAAR